MTEPRYTILEDRAVLTLSGEDRAEFLQGMISNDVGRIATDRAIWAGLLTPQGKYRHDFFIVDQPTDDGARYLIECEGGERMMDAGTTLRRYVLRSDVTLGIARDYAVVVAFGDGIRGALGLPDETGAAGAFGGGVAYVDPRHQDGGVRILGPKERIVAALEEAGVRPVERTEWDGVRIPLGLPDGSRDMEVDKAILLENGFDELGGVDWKKGCYMGQELTARTKYRGLVKKRLIPIRAADESPEITSGAKVTSNGKEAGTVTSTAGSNALALLRLKSLDGPLEVEGTPVEPVYPDWMTLTQEEERA